MDELDDTQRMQLARELQDLADSLVAQVADGTGRTNTVTLDQSAVGRISRIDAIQQQKMALAEVARAKHRLDAVRRALVWVRDDEYGWCRKCDEPIGVRRLTARPEAPFCVGCATAMGQ